MNAICFKARYVGKTPIKKRQDNGRYADKEVSVLKVSVTKSDMNALRDLSELWDYESNFVSSILINYEYYKKENKIIYLLSEQEKGFKKLEPEKILGIAGLTKNKGNYKVDYIQTRPDCINKKKQRPFKKIGDAMMVSIIKLTGDFKIYLDALKEIVEFYKRFGFKVVQEDIQAPLMLLIKKRHLH